MRKILFAVLALCMLAVPALAGIPAKTELGLIGEFVQTDTGDDPWTLNMDLLFPVNKSGTLILGPAFAIGNDDDLTRLGGGLEWNLTGQKKGGLFIGASAFYFTKDQDDADLDAYNVVAKAGLKFNVGRGAAVKAYAFQVVDGRFSDDSDIGAAIGIIAKF
jgi:hypothetical protein